jgi:hypothetical protein
MPLYVYKIENFNQVLPKELDQFKTFASILYKEFHNAEDTCLFISNFAIPGNKKRSTTPVDGILITPKCIAVIDFKAYSGIITAKLNGSWIFQENENSKEIPIDGGSGTKTVLGQITINHDALAEYLKELSKEIEIKENSFNFYKSVSCIVAFIDIIKLNNEIGDGLPFGLGICDSNSFKETLDRLHKETSRRLHRSKLLTNDEIDKIRLKLNISSCLMQESEYKDYKSKYSKQTGKSTENSHNINTAKSSSKKDAPKPEHPQRTNIEHRPVESEEDSNRQQRTITGDSNAVKPIQPINQRPAQTSDTLQRPTTTANSTANAPIRPSTQQQPNSVRPVIQPTHQLEKQVSKPQAITIQKETKPVINTINTQDSKAKKNHDDYILGLPDSQFSFERYKNSDLYFLRVKHIDGSIECLTKPIFREEGSSFHNGLSTVSMQDYKSYFINKLGNPVSKGYDFHSIMPFGEIYRMSQSCRYGLLNKVGNEIAPARYDIIKAFNCGVAVFRINKKYGVISDSGKELVRPMYDYISPFNNDVAVVCLDHKCGVINTSGKTVVPIAHYDYISKFEDGVASAKIGTKWGVIDTSGKVVVPVMYDGIHECTSKGSIVINNLWNLSLNSKGAIKSKKISISDFLEYTICGATIVHIICLILLYLLCTGIVNWQDQFLHLSSVNKLVYTSLFIIEFVTIIINSLFVLPEYNGDRGGGYIGENASPIICIIPFVGFLIIVWLILLAITYYMGSFDYCDVIRDICTFVTPIALIVMNIYAFWDEWKCNRKWYLRRAEYDPNC